MKARPSARHAYVEAEVATALAHQVRSLRQQRHLSQGQLARLLGTTQTAVSRLEDPSYGRASLKTLLQLGKVFDVGLQVRFVSLVRMLEKTFVPNPANDRIRPFEEEAEEVGFAHPVVEKFQLAAPGAPVTFLVERTSAHVALVGNASFATSIVI